MPTPWLSSFSRLTAGALLFQATAPVALDLKTRIDAESARRTAFERAGAPPAPMKGVPSMRAVQGLSGPGLHLQVPQPSREPDSLLDETARKYAASDAKAVDKWRIELREPGLSAKRRAWLNLWIGESRLAAEEPDDAEAYLARAQRLGGGTRVAGIAAYDLAAAKFYEGYFAQSGHLFRALLKSKAKGFVAPHAAYFARHADACLGYHQQHEALGIPQPRRLDPLCGVAGLTVVLRSMGMPHDKATMLKTVPHHGMGSSAQDIAKGAERLGLTARILGASERGLRALPKPLVARVEHDHFVTVVDADKSGVEYVCSDCGPWPGGPIRLTWKQWRAMEADAYVAITKPGSPADRALGAVLKGVSASKYGQSAQRGRGDVASVLATKRLLARYEAPDQIVVTDPDNPSTPGGGGSNPPAWMLPYAFPLQCGSTFDALACDCDTSCPKDRPAPRGFGPSLGDPVNLATGEEEYTPGPDITVYNPKGPSVSWSRLFNSMQWHTDGSNYYDVRWSTNYSISVSYGSDYNGNFQGWDLVQPNKAKIRFTLPTGATAPNASNPSVALESPRGVRLAMTWKWNSTLNDSYFEIVSPDRTRIVTTPYSMYTYGRGNYWSHGANIDRIYDASGNYIQFHYSHTNVDYLVSIDDSDGVPLLTLGYDPTNIYHGTSGTAKLVSLTDRYGRSVYYAQTPAGPQQTYLDVSQLVATGASNSPIRYRYLIGPGPGVHVNYPTLQAISVPSPTGTGLSTATINYDPNTGYVSSIVDGNGNRREYSQGKDAAGNLLANHTLVTIKDPAGNVVQKYTVGFDANMNQTELINGQGQLVWQKTFGNTLAPKKPSSITDGNGRTWNYTYDKYGNVLTATTPKGTTTTYSYSDANFSLKELTSIQEGAKTPTTFTYYQPSGLVHQIFRPISGQVGGGTAATTCWYDAMGNLTQVANPGNNAVAARSIYFGYTTDAHVPGDPAGSTYTQAECLRRPIRITDSLGKVAHLRYDVRGNLISRTDSLGNQVQSAYNLADQKTVTAFPPTINTGSGSEILSIVYLYVGGPAIQSKVFNESGTNVRTTSSTYGAEGESVTRSGSTEATTGIYDAAYNVKVLKDGNNGTTTYDYDLAGRTTQIAYPGASGTNFDKVRFTSYDAVGNLLSRTDGNGQVTNYAYSDADGELSFIGYVGAAANNVALTYDAYDRLVARTDATGSYAWRYDDLNNRTGEDTSYPGIPTQTVSFEYYNDGSRKAVVLPAGRRFEYGYDADGRCTAMSLYGSSTGASFAYLDNGWEASRTMPNGLTTNYTYNAIGALTGLTNAVGSTAVSQYGNFGYDGAFNLTSMTASVPGVAAHSGTTTYGYDAQDRLTSESSTRLGGYAQTNAYDAADNPTTLRGAAATFNADNQRTGAGYAYDGNGSPTTYKGAANTYDVEGRLTSRGSFSTAYRADGLRAWKDVAGGGTRKWFLYVDGHSWMEINPSGQPDAINAWAPDGLIGRRQGPNWEFYAYDPQGSVAQRTDAAGAVLASAAYDAYGNASWTGTQPEIFAYNARWGYVSDRETGLYYCHNRYYDPQNGRWVTRDPMSYAGGINLYGYCLGSPTGLTDPSGYHAMAGVLGGGLEGVLAGVGEAVSGMGTAISGILGTSVEGGPAGVAIGLGAVGGAIGGVAIDNATGGKWHEFWCRVFHVDCEGTMELPQDLIDQAIDRSTDDICDILPETIIESDWQECEEIVDTACSFLYPAGTEDPGFANCKRMGHELCELQRGVIDPSDLDGFPDIWPPM